MLMIAFGGIGIEENCFGPVVRVFVLVGLYPKDLALPSGPAPVRGDVYRLAIPLFNTARIIDVVGIYIRIWLTLIPLAIAIRIRIWLTCI